MLVVILDGFRTHRKHLDSAQERVLPPSKTDAPGKPGRACHLNEAGAGLPGSPGSMADNMPLA